jgi:D-3-phosphoglycerate dehydrogenase
MERLPGSDILVIANGKLDRQVLSAMPDLKFISVAFTGVDHVDLEFCRDRGIEVSNASGYSTPAVAELAFGMMISLLRSIPKGDGAVRHGGTRAGLIGRELAGRTLGILGTGAIGLRVAELGRAFGMRLLGWNRTERQAAVDMGLTYKPLEGVLEASDIVTVHLPLNDSTRGLLDDIRLGRMKQSALLINTARGPIVDSAALALALKEGRLAGAGVDVFETEPPIPSDHPLLGAPNCLLAPHVGFATEEALVRRLEIAVSNVEEWVRGRRQNSIL